MDWVGDCGGLFDGLIRLTDLLINPMAVYALQTKLASLIVNFKKSETNKELNTDGDDDGESKNGFDNNSPPSKTKKLK